MARHLLNRCVHPCLLLSFLVPGLLLAGCRHENGVATHTPGNIQIGLLAPLTGHDNEWLGRQMVYGATMAVHGVNEAGGLLVGDRRFLVVLVVADDANSPEVAVSAAQRLINQAQVVAIVGPAFDNTAVPVATVAERAGIPMISPAATDTRLTAYKPYVFRGTFNDTVQADALARFAAQELRLEKAAIVYDAATVENQSLAELFQRAFEERGGSIVALEAYSTQIDQSLEQSLARVESAGAELLFLPGIPPDLLLEELQVREPALNVTLLGSSRWERDSLYAEAVFEGAYFSNHFCPEPTAEPLAAFSEQYTALYGQEPGSLASLTFDSLGLIFHAVQRETEIDPASIRQGLYNSRHIGVTGPYIYDDGGNPNRDVAIWRIAGSTAACIQLLANP
jgi:branched-chain amino acid transport system substrate-binding protein